MIKKQLYSILLLAPDEVSQWISSRVLICSIYREAVTLDNQQIIYSKRSQRKTSRIPQGSLRRVLGVHTLQGGQTDLQWRWIDPIRACPGSLDTALLNVNVVLPRSIVQGEDPSKMPPRLSSSVDTPVRNTCFPTKHVDSVSPRRSRWRCMIENKIDQQFTKSVEDIIRMTCREKRSVQSIPNLLCRRIWMEFWKHGTSRSGSVKGLYVHYIGRKRMMSHTTLVFWISNTILNIWLELMSGEDCPTKWQMSRAEILSHLSCFYSNLLFLCPYTGHLTWNLTLHAQNIQKFFPISHLEQSSG